MGLPAWSRSLAEAVVPARSYEDDGGMLAGLLHMAHRSDSLWEWRTLSTTVWAFGFLVLLVGVLSIIIVRPARKDRRNSSAGPD